MVEKVGTGTQITLIICATLLIYAWITRPFELAAIYVFTKQSVFSCHCDQLLTQLAPLIPKLQGQFAEFPRLDYANTP